MITTKPVYVKGWQYHTYQVNYCGILIDKGGMYILVDKKMILFKFEWFNFSSYGTRRCES